MKKKSEQEAKDEIINRLVKDGMVKMMLMDPKNIQKELDRRMKEKDLK